MQASRCCVRCASSQEMAEHLRVSTPAHELFELILMQGDAVQQITLILGGSIIVHTEPFADNTELVEHFNGRRGHPFDFNIHSKTPFPKMPKCKGQEPSRGHKLSILENVVSIRDFTSSTLVSFRSALVGACLPQTLLGTSTPNRNFQISLCK